MIYTVLYQLTGTYALVYLTEKDGKKATFPTETQASIAAELLVSGPASTSIQARVMDGDRTVYKVGRYQQ